MTYDATWDLPHAPTEDADWQESDCYWAYDARQGVGLFHRLGQCPNRASGQLQLFVFRTGGHRFKQVTQSHPGTLLRTATGQRVGGSTADSLGGLRMGYTWNEPDCQGDVEFYESFYTPRNWHPPADGVQYERDMHDGGHLECSGRLRGLVRIGDEQIEIDALAHRDRSWGRRSLGASYQHRMCTGTVGTTLSWATVLVQFTGGGLVKMGFVAREGKVEQLRDVEFLTTLAYDSLSLTAATTRLHLQNGEMIEIQSRTEHGFINNLLDYTYSTDNIMSLDIGGIPGFCYYTAAVNPAKGGYVPQPSEVATIAVRDGLERA